MFTSPFANSQARKKKKELKRETTRGATREKLVSNTRKTVVSKEKKISLSANEKKIIKTDRNVGKRQEVIREILKCGNRLSILPETQYLAICFFEQYLSSHQWACELPKKFSEEEVINSFLLAVILLFMSSKLNDVNFPNPRMLDIKNPDRLMELIIEGERHLLNKINFMYIEESPYVLFCNSFPKNKNFIKKCCYFFEKTILESWSEVYGWQTIARAVVYTLDSDILEATSPVQRIQIRDLSGRIKKLLHYQIY